MECRRRGRSIRRLHCLSNLVAQELWQLTPPPEPQEVFERFTNRSRRVLVLAQEESRELGHSFIGTEHLLSGLMHEASGRTGAISSRGLGDPGRRKSAVAI
jgi:hypothetical protein